MKRVLSVLLIVVLSLTLLTACATDTMYGRRGNVSTTNNGYVNGTGYSTDGNWAYNNGNGYNANQTNKTTGKTGGRSVTDNIRNDVNRAVNDMTGSTR